MGNFNIVDIIICAVLALSLVSGMHKGFMGSILALGGFIGSWFAALQLYDKLADAVKGIGVVTDFLGSIASPLETLFKTPGLAAAAVTQAGDVMPGGTLTYLQQAAADIKDLRIINTMFENNVMGRLFADNGLNTMGQYLTQTIAEALINVLSFIVAFAVIYFAALLVVNLLNNVFHFPSFRHLDWLLGGVLGVVRGVAIVFLIFAVMPTVLTMLDDLDIPQMRELINQSALTGWFSSDYLSNLIGNLLG